VTRIRLLCLLALAAAAPAPPPLVVAVPPGAVHDPLRRLLLKPYADTTETAFADPAWDGETLDALKTLAPDLVLVSGEKLRTGCTAGLFRKLDWSRLPRDRYLPQATTDCGAGAYITAIALAWDRDKFPGQPTWSDFWDVARHPGRRALQRTARANLEIALLADGVASSDVYRTLRSPDGLDRAFRKLDQLKPYIQWWDQPAQPAQWLATGKVLLTSAPAAGLAAPRHRLAALWIASLTEVKSFAIPQSAPHPEAAQLALLLAADPARQAQLAQAAGVGPAVPAALDLLPQPARAQNLATPENLRDALPLDDAFWSDNRAKLEPRFAAWLAK
jgi:putative spermidine/putrescine transport system substrate-binding protein